MQALSRTRGAANSVLQPTERAFTLTPIAPTRNPEVVEMTIGRFEIRFREEELPIMARFERLLERIFRMRRVMEEVRVKNLEALGRGEERS